MIRIDVHEEASRPQMAAGWKNVGRHEAKLGDEGWNFLPLQRSTIIHHLPAKLTQEEL